MAHDTCFTTVLLIGQSDDIIPSMAELVDENIKHATSSTSFIFKILTLRNLSDNIQTPIDIQLIQNVLEKYKQNIQASRYDNSTHITHPLLGLSVQVQKIEHFCNKQDNCKRYN